jgi:hypothetical protein
MLTASNIHYELSDRCQATSYGGIGAIHLMVQKLGLVEAIDESLQLLKRHLPYHESDHVLNLGYAFVPNWFVEITTITRAIMCSISVTTSCSAANGWRTSSCAATTRRF